MAIDRSEALLAKIGNLLAEDKEYPLDSTLLHAELDRSFVAPSIFKDLGNHVLYRWPDLRVLGDTLLELWETQTGKSRWTEIEYLIRDGKFEVTYIYPDEIVPDEDSLIRRDRLVRKYFGEKPIVYPPMPEDDSPSYDL